jgi:hypothetical protein
MATLLCILFDKTDNKLIIESFNENDIVLFRNERYRWRGLNFIDGQQYIILEKDGRGKNGKIINYVLFKENKSLIKPYYGTSNLTDGRGIRRKDNKRAEFISYVLGIPETEVPSVTGASTVIVTERDTFDRLSKGIRINYDSGKSIGLLDIVTASYYTDSGEEYQYGNNPSKTEPVLKIAGKISTARDLVLEKRGNKVVGLMVINSDVASKGGSELVDMLGRKSLTFVHIAFGIDSEYAENVIETQEDGDVFACTREFLLQNSLPIQERNNLTISLDRQVENIVNNSVSIKIIDGGCMWEDFRKAREALSVIKRSGWNEEEKKAFLIASYSLFNLFITAVFPIETMEKYVGNGKFMTSISSPALRILELWDLTAKAEFVEDRCAYVVNTLERLYKSGFTDCQKHNALKCHLETSKGRKIAVVVPKAYYVDILSDDEAFQRKGITIITANRFDNSVSYDEIIVVGDFKGKHFNPLKCRAATNIILLLYECETNYFNYKKHKAKLFEKKLNSKLNIAPDEKFNDRDLKVDGNMIEDMDAFVEEGIDLEKYLKNISTFDIRKYAETVSGTAGSTLTSEVVAIGRFVSSEQILFSKYYKAVVFNTERGTVSEVDVEELSVGDQLVFVKRDDYTLNMVDYIYENLQINSHLSIDVLDATEKAAYWKEALREYKDTNNLSYRDIAKGLQKLGSSLQEVSVRQWLIEESHIVGPRDETTLQQIAELTEDPFLLEDTHCFFEACRIVRHQRKEILELIGKAITDKLSGHRPKKGSILEVVHDNVERLTDTFELDAFTQLEETVAVPINLINKPITDWEVTV